MTDPHPFKAAVVGAGPAGLMAAETLARDGFSVTVFDRMPTPARKLLIAGRGGLNLTHSEPLDAFLSRYRGSMAADIRSAVEAFPPERLVQWCEGLGEATFVGSSGRVFPRAMKASPLLRAWLRRLGEAGVTLKSRHRWTGFGDGGALMFDTPEGQHAERATVTVLALGGASWPHLGSDAAWVPVLDPEGGLIEPFVPQNSGFRVAWSDVFRERFAGEPLKRIAVAFGGEVQRGEAMITKDGIEGGAIYALSGIMRDTLMGEGTAQIAIDLKPDGAHEDVMRALSKPRGKASLATFLRKALNLSPQAIGLLQEAAHRDGVSLSALDMDALARRVKRVALGLIGMAPITRAISSAGGVRRSGVDANLMLRGRPGVFVAGEMLDWEAPTGGYLLQASFATGFIAATAAAAWARHAQR